MTRSRMLDLLHQAVALANGRRARVAAHVLLVLGLGFVILRMRSIWRESGVEFQHVEWGWLAGATAIAGTVAVASGFIWLAVLRRLGAVTRASWSGIFMQSQLGKYLPGTLWQYAGRGALARAHGLPLRIVARSLPAELLATAYAAAAYSVFVVGWWGAAGVAVAISAAHIAGMLSSRKRGVVRTAAWATALYGLIWPLVGASFWMTARAFVHVPLADLALYTGVFAAAWVVGLVAIYAPGGLGVREALIVALLRGKLGSADALAIAVASRGVMTLADVGAASIGFLTLRLRRSPDPDRWIRYHARFGSRARSETG
jgi:glycosyltransferase 2 family protein